MSRAMLRLRMLIALLIKNNKPKNNHMKIPVNAHDAHRSLAAAYNTGDLKTVLNMYDTDGIIVAEPGNPVSGREKFEAAVKGILGIKGVMEIKTVYCLESGDV